MGDKITINGKEFDSDDVEKLMSQGDDYTKKTQALSDREKTLDGEFENLKEYQELDKYIKQHPDFAPNLNTFIKKDIAQRYGYGSPEGNNRANPNPAGQQNKTNVGGSMYTPDPNAGGENIAGGEYPNGYTPPGDNPNPEDKPLSRKEMAAMLDERDAVRDAKSRDENMRKELGTRLSVEYNDLEKKGYNKEELQQVVETAKKSNKFFIETAKVMAFDGVLPDRFKAAAPPPNNGGVGVVGRKFEGDIPHGQVPAGFVPLKGSPGSGFDLPDPEKDLVKYGNDPGEYLRANPDKFIIKE